MDGANSETRRTTRYLIRSAPSSGSATIPWGMPQCSVSPTSPRYEHTRVTGTPVPSEMRAMYSDATRSPLFSITNAGLRPPSQAPAQIENPTPSLHTGT